MPGSPVPDAPLSSEHLGAQLRKERIRATLFKKPPPLIKIERFTLLERVGAGSMSEVFAAYDERLDRRVAIKLVRGGSHRDADAETRLLREAQTLARLSHPNVVQVYDAGQYEGRVFIAMEFIRGRTLSEWLDELRDLPIRRRQQEIVRCIRHAGRGLEAAHQAGLTHRDVKPNNVVVGDDGRVRVVDFGLARTSGPAEASSGEYSGEFSDESGETSDVEERPADLPERPASGRSERHLLGDTRASLVMTPLGAVLGTPAYMAPELFRGQAADSRSDQFSFCVTLYEALHGERPYPRTSGEAVRAGFSSADVLSRSRARDIPGPIRDVLARGLAVEPERRFADMGKLLAALDEWPRRRFLPWLVFGLIAVLVAGAWLGTRSTQVAYCQGAARELAGVWNPERRSALQRVVSATGRAYASEAWPLIDRGLDRYATNWQVMHRDACMAHREGRQSGPLLDKRMLCLQRRRASLASTLDVLEEVEASELERALQAVQSLPDIGYCGDVEALNAQVAPPEDPAIATRVRALSQRLERGKAQERMGRHDKARTIAREVVHQAEGIGYDPLLGDALLTEGRAIVKTEDRNVRDKAIAPLQRAVQVGLRAHMDSLAVEAFARLVYARGTSEAASQAVVEFAPTIEALGARLTDNRFAYALLLNNIGTVYLALEDKERARAYFEQALEAGRSVRAGALSTTEEAVGDESDGPAVRVEALDNLELLAASHNLAMLIEENRAREALLGGVLQRLETMLGPSHTRTLLQRILAASFIEDPQSAHDTLAPACRAYERQLADNSDGLLRCLYKLGFLAAELGHRAEGAGHLAALVAHASRAAARDSRGASTRSVTVELAEGYANLYRGEHAFAQHSFARALATLPAEPEHWWVEKNIADARLGLGAVHMAQGDYSRAQMSLERATVIYERLSGRNYNTEYRRRLARARLLLAETLWRGLLAGSPANTDSPGRVDPNRERATDASRSLIKERVSALLDAAELWYTRADGQSGPSLAEVHKLRSAMASDRAPTQPESDEAEPAIGS